MDTFLSPAMALYFSAGVLLTAVMGSVVTWLTNKMMRRRENYIQL